MTDDTLDEQLSVLEADLRYKPLEILKTRDDETTELVERDGVHYVRKSFRIGDDAARMEELGEVYRLLGGIESDHLAHLVETYHLSDTFVVISEYVEGRTLAESVAADGPLDRTAAERMMDDICEAVIALHTQGRAPLIHRDITPDNIVLTERGAKLIDFGIMRRFRNERPHDTRIVGTAGYAAPEQYGFGQTSVESDIYSLGVVFYHALTGIEPGAGIQSMVMQEQSLSGQDRSTIMHCIRLNPTERYRSVRDLRQAIAGGRQHGAGSSQVSSVIGRHSQGIHRFIVVMASIIFWLFTVVFLAGPWTSRGAATTGDFLINLVLDWSMVPLLLAPTYLFICNPGDFLHRWRFFKKHRLLKIILVILACIIVEFILIELASGSFSPEYQAYMAAKRATT